MNLFPGLFLLCYNALYFYFRWSYAIYFVNYPRTVVLLFVSLKRLLVLLQSLTGLQVLLQSMKSLFENSLKSLDSFTVVSVYAMN